MLSPTTGQIPKYYSPVRHSSPESKLSALPFDLHVLGMPPAFNLSQDQTLQFKALSLKQSVIPTPNYLEFRLVLTLEFASANSSASTHTNYLTVLLKNDPRFPGQTHNYTGGAPSLASARLPSYLVLGSAEGHRTLSERGIIAARNPPSTAK